MRQDAAEGRGRVSLAAAAGVGVLVPVAMLAAACSPASSGAGSASPAPSGAAASHPAGPPSPSARSASPGTAGTASPRTASGAGGATAPAVASGDCATSALKVSLGPAGAAAGSAYVPIRFTNVSSRGCTLSGYPGVSFVTAPGGGQVGNAAARMPLPDGHARPVTLRPGQVASAGLQVADAGNYPTSRCSPANGPYLRVFPPGQTAARYVRTGFGPGAACASRAVTILRVEPVQPGAAPAGGG